MSKRFKLVVCWSVMLVFLFTLCPLSAFATPEEADAVFYKGNIYTVDEKNPKAQALVVRGDKLIYVGSTEEASKWIGTGTKVVDLEGKTVLPGLIDAHLHFPGEGTKQLQIDAFWKPKQEILDAVAEEYRNAKPGEWIKGRGWNQEVWDPAVFPTKEDLDKVAPDIPVILTRTCGHATWVNSKALEIAGITNDTEDPVGGEILRDANGEATGILTDQAQPFVTQHVPDFSDRQYIEALQLASKEVLSYGLTTVHDLGSGFEMIDLMKQLYESGDLKVRLYTMARVPGRPTTEELLTGLGDILANKPEIGLYNNHLTVRCVKISSDGSLGARSAWMLEDYSDRTGHPGNGKFSDEEIYQIVKKVRDAGWQVAIHAIGDACNRQTLDAMEKVLKKQPMEDHRYRIEHAQIVALEDIPRFAELGVLPSMQTVHATSDKNMAEDRVGPERIKGAYAWRKFIDAGSIIPNGTDAAVELVNPYHGLFAAVTRQSRDEEPAGGWYPGECMTRMEALKSYTLWAAYSGFDEKIKGSLEAGKLADFVVIDRDYMTCPVNEIKDIQALMTVVGGEIVYERDSKAPTVIWQGLPVIFNTGPVNVGGHIYAPADRMIQTIGVPFAYELNGSGHLPKNATQAILVDGQGYLSVRYICEKLNYRVSWCKESNTISITK